METLLGKGIDGLNLDRSEWQLVKFGDVAIQQKQTVNRENTDLTRYVKGEHMYSEDLHLREWGELKDEYLGPAFIRKFEEGDILYGSRRTYLRKVVIAPFDGITSNTTFVIKANEGRIDKRLLPYIMLSEGFSQHSIRNSKGSVNPYVNWKDLSGFEFLLPPLDQQANLVDIFTSMDQTLEGYWKVKYSLEIKKRRVTYDCYYSEDIEKVSLGDLCQKIQDGSHFSPQNIFEENNGERYRYVTSKNIRKTGIEFKKDQYVDKEFHESIYNRCDTVKGDVLLTKDGVNTGTATINTLDEEVSLLSSVCLIRANTKLTTNEYICQYFNSDIGDLNLKNLMTGTAITRLTLTTLNSIKIPVPDLHGQKQITKELSKIDDCIKNTTQSIETSRLLQKSIINQVF